jgi:hypothetical protein
MSDKLLRFGAGGATSLTPLAAALLVLASLAIFVLPRRHLIVPLLFTSIFIPWSQQVEIGGLNFMVFRILLVVAWAKILMTGGRENPGTPQFRLNAIDKAVVWWVVVSSVAFVALWREFGAVILRLGVFYNTFGFYFLFRVLFREEADGNRAIKTLSAICVVVAACMAIEHFTTRNFFSMFGGVPEFSYVREGRLRAQAAFGHPILAGTFGAILFPLFSSLFWQPGSRRAGFIGCTSSAVITVMSASSTPLMALTAGFSALYLIWPLRRWMRTIRWGIVLTLVALHIVMNAPVWALIARIDLTGGSASDHRYQLVNQTILHFRDWWLFGTTNVSAWGFEMGDTSNTYVDACVTGGLMSLIMFVAIIVCGFKAIGRARARHAGDLAVERQAWALGSALFANVIAYIGIVYFDQTIIAWYVLLALIPVCGAAARERAAVSVSAPSMSVQRAAWSFGSARPA